MVPLTIPIFSIPHDALLSYNQTNKLFLSKQSKRKNGRKEKSSAAAVAVLGIISTGLVDLEVHWQARRRDPGFGYCNPGCGAFDNHHRRYYRCAHGFTWNYADDKGHLWLIQFTPEAESASLGSMSLDMTHPTKRLKSF